MKPSLPQPVDSSNSDSTSSTFDATKFKELLKKLAARKTSV